MNERICTYLDLEDKVVDNAFCDLNFVVDDQAKSNKVRIPAEAQSQSLSVHRRRGRIYL